MTRRSSAGTPQLLARAATPGLSITALVALLTLIVALCCGLVPRALAALSASDLRHSVTSLADPRRDVSGAVIPFLIGDSPNTPSPENSVERAFGRVDSALHNAKAQASAPLRAVLGEPHVVARSARQPVTPLQPKGTYYFALAADPRYEQQLKLTSGALPQPWQLPADSDASSSSLSGLQGDASGAPPIELVVSTQTAKRMDLTVGEVFLTSISDLSVQVRVSGIFDPVKPDSDYWQNTPSIVSPIFHPGINNPDQYTATGFVNPLTLTAFQTGTGSQYGVFTGAFWFPVDARAVTSANARGVKAGIEGLQERQISIPAAEKGETVRVPVKTDLGTEIGQSLGRIAATLAVIAVLVSGPGGVVIAVFALAVRAVLQRRAPVLALVAARGASAAQLRGAAVLEGLVAGVPAAALGAVIAAGISPGSDAWAWVAPLLAGLVPAVLFGVLGGGAASSGIRTTRRDLSARARGSVRWVVEACVVGAAAIATYLLVRRGPIADAGFDPLLALTPLLLALAVSIVVLRLLPLALRAGLTIARRGRGPVGFIGAARAMRDPALGVAAALAVVVGVSIAVLSSGVLATIQAGAQAQAVAAVGADVRADSAVFTPKTIARAQAAPGVARVAGVGTGANLDLGLNGKTSTVQPIFAPSTELGAVRGDVPSDLAHKVDGRVPVVVSSDLLETHAIGAKQRLGDVPVVIVGSLPGASQLGADSRWVLVDSAYAEQLSGSAFEATRLFVSLRPGAGPAPVETAVMRAAPYAVVTDAAAAVAVVNSAPAASGLRLSLVIGAVGSALLAAIAVFAGSVTAGSSRNRAIAMLRTMGLTVGQSLGLVVWEIVPVVVAAAAVGLGLGLAMPRLLVATTDFAPFTGGTAHLAVATDWAQLAELLAGVLGVAALATLVAVLVARRTDPTGTVKMGAE
ncbi:FtsX-like permease family protein [Gryllotalpicola protaetiae]|uniref:FtsX-like permease family protein n=1 Tax=Gryllotalpicola protaetiae TaxID=2419771 RepID=A0A387BJ60_9MICO|nr:FtsX-like permease family protein [Gryllotalpicola protaetiae]AYG02272.1 FtsX-like permease family protein [Gryllotalpicola protaetiae]